MQKSVYNPIVDSAIFVMTWVGLSFQPGTMERTSIDILTDKLRGKNLVFGQDLSGQQVDRLKSISMQAGKLNSVRHLTPAVDVRVEFPEVIQAYDIFCQDGFVSFEEVLWAIDYPQSNPDLLNKIKSLTSSIESQMIFSFSLAA